MTVRTKRAIFGRWFQNSKGCSNYSCVRTNRKSTVVTGNWCQSNEFAVHFFLFLTFYMQHNPLEAQNHWFQLCCPVVTLYPKSANEWHKSTQPVRSSKPLVQFILSQETSPIFMTLNIFNQQIQQTTFWNISYFPRNSVRRFMQSVSLENVKTYFLGKKNKKNISSAFFFFFFQHTNQNSYNRK